MKTLLLSLTSLIIVSTSFSQEWVMQVSNTTANLNDVHFIDAENGFAVGNEGAILKTVDGGELWQVMNSGTEHDMKAVHFLNTQVGFATNWYELLKTTDGGMTWDVQIYSEDRLAPIVFKDSLVGHVCGRGILHNTIDGGETWTNEVAPGGFFSLSCANVSDSGKIYLSGSDLMVFSRETGGEQWDLLNSFVTGGSSTKDIHFINENTGFYCGFNFAQGYFYSRFRRTSDGGESWTAPLIGTDIFVNSIFFPENDRGYLCGFEGEIMRSTDSGINWTEQFSPTNTGLNKVYFPDSQTGYIVGDGGVILKIENALSIADLDLNEEFNLFPNPAQNSVSLEFPSQELIPKKIEIFNSVGQLVKKVIDLELNGNTVRIDISELTSGVYTIRTNSAQYLKCMRFIKQY